MENKKIVIDGVGADAEVITNAAGGKQSKSPMAMHLVDPSFLNDWFNMEDLVIDGVISNITDHMKYDSKLRLIEAIFELHTLLNDGDATDEDKALVEIAKVLQYGADRYEPNNWRLIPEEEHINHALIHYIAYKLGDTQDEHLQHCMCRLMMAYATEKSENFSYNTYIPKN